MICLKINIISTFSFEGKDKTIKKKKKKVQS